jgi:hypothetical protein
MDDHTAKARQLLTLIGKKEKQLDRRKGWWTALIQGICAVCLLAAMGAGFLYLKTEIETVGLTAKQVDALKTQMAALDSREQVTTLTARIDQLLVAKEHLEAAVAQMQEDLETLKIKQQEKITASRPAKMKAPVRKTVSTRPATPQRASKETPVQNIQRENAQSGAGTPPPSDKTVTEE